MEAAANRPLVGFMNMFFQISAATGGMMKNGEMTRMRTGPWPQIGWSIRSAMRMPPTTVMTSTPRVRISVLRMAPQKAGEATKFE